MTGGVKGAVPGAATGREEADAQPVDEPPRVLFLGRPNSGKTSLYNAITGARAHVGNFPGITVDVLDAEIGLPSGRPARLIDLPGIYTLHEGVEATNAAHGPAREAGPASSSLGDAAPPSVAATDLDLQPPETDEAIARAFLERTRAASTPYLIVQIIDVTRLRLALSLTEELVRMGVPLVIALTQQDQLTKEGSTLDPKAIAAAYGVPVQALSARDADARQRMLELIERGLQDGVATGDSAASPGGSRALDPDAGEARARTVAREAIAARALPAQQVPKVALTARLDTWLLHPILGPVLFLGLMGAVFFAVFLIADPATALCDRLTQGFGAALEHRLGKGLVVSFLTDGLLAGAGTVLAFLPQIALLSLAMEFLDANGYLARGAFLLDRVLRSLGLSGRSFLPLLMGHACAVPAVASTRIIRDPKERLTTILVLPLMTCSARIPTYALLLTTFFGHRSALFRSGLFVALYAAGVGSGLIASLVLRRTKTRGRSLPFVLEMPAYRAPQVKALAQHVWRTGARFVRDVGTTVVAASAVLWVLLYVPMPFADAKLAGAPPIERSVAAVVGRSLEPVTLAAGFDWRINVGLIGSFGARELMVGTLGVIMGVEGADENPAPLSEKLRTATNAEGKHVYSTRTGLALLVFFVLACQCLSTLAAIRRETKTLRWPLFVLGYTYFAGYVAAVIVYQVSGLLGVT